uniref:MDR-like ABC transporter n=1 Tax=Oryza nivara TaxID=4536 RepID=A0A0E0G319_ORYNI
MGSEGGGGGGGGKAKTKAKPKPALVSFMTVFVHVDKADVVLMVLGLLGAIANGISMPVMLLTFSHVYNDLGHGTDIVGQQFGSKVNMNARNLVFLAAGLWVMAFLEGYCWARTAERQVSLMRARYLRAVLRQDMEYLDLKKGSTAEVITGMSNDTTVVQDVLSEKIPNFVMNAALFAGSYGVGLALMWKLVLPALPSVLLLIIPGFIYGGVVIGLARRSREQYTHAGAIAEQAISSVRTVYSFVAERTTMAQFSAALEKSVRLGLKQGLAKGVAIGSNGIAFAILAFNVWYGSRLVMYHGYQGGTVFAVSFVTIRGGLALGSALSSLKFLLEASLAAERILEVIRRVPKIDSESDTGEELANVAGEVEFRNVDFCYPSRPESPIFVSFSLRVPAGRTVALVGGSGSGKSTVIALLERFYDPSAGEVTVDGVDIRRLRLKWLRAQMGLVSQEPALFATSIRENILFGKEDAPAEEVVAAAKAANAHNFISQLPQGYDTQVGERGVQMSGGQKQRIAIARAILKSPKILLLDEATSALDTESERIVQEALDMASMGRTTIIIAHRLSTIRNADIIVVMQSGEVMELGPHDELIANENGLYSSLVRLQQTRDSNEIDQICVTGSTSGVEQSNIHIMTRRFSTVSRSNSARSLGDARDADNTKKQKLPVPSFRRLLMLNAPEWKQSLMGGFSAILFGGIQPTYSYTLGSMISAYLLTDHAEIKDNTRTNALIFLGLAVLSFFLNIGQHYNFGAMGKYLTKRIKEQMLAKILTFEIGWFDRDKNSSGPLCSQLAKYANISMSEKSKHAQAESSKLATEAVSNLQTVTAFSSQERILCLFNQAQDGPRKESIRQSWFAGLGLGTPMSLVICTWALELWYCGRLVADHQITNTELFQTFYILVNTGFTLSIQPGKSTDIVGKSGSGKSTIIGLIERFYDPIRGLVKIDGRDIKAYNLRALRRHIGLVNQEPTLFTGTIRDNIVYGIDIASEVEIEDAARSANAHDFISNLKDGYDTLCGERGVQLSGGQKQRIAIARAILKNPAILLLDEATSALDSQSEKVVQEALDRVMVGRTSVVVAHRLSIIQKCDLITVLEKGTIVEKGTHTSLMAKGFSGTYCSLVSLQQAGNQQVQL